MMSERVSLNKAVEFACRSPRKNPLFVGAALAANFTLAMFSSRPKPLPRKR